MSLLNVYNEKYGSCVASNGTYIAVGNPPSKDWDSYEGFGRIGEVVLIKKNNFVDNYSVVKTLTNQFNYVDVNPYYTEQSASSANTSSLIRNYGDVNNINSCSFITIEAGSQFVYQSKFGQSLDLSEYFLAVSDVSFSQSLFLGNFIHRNSVSIYEINPNYVFDNSEINRIQPSKELSNKENLDNYEIPNSAICTITGSAKDEFGKSVSISNNYLAIGAPKAFNGKGAVYVYKYTNPDCSKYTLNAVLTSSTVVDPNQIGFGFSVSIEKDTENKILVGSNQVSGGKVYLFDSSSKGWVISQRFVNITGSDYLKIEGQSFDLVPSSSLSQAQLNNNFGYSVSINKNVLVIGSPTDLLYFEYTGSQTLRQRGAAYIFANNECPTGSLNYKLISKTYGDDKTFKDNLFGYSVSTYDGKVLIGTPKPFFPFSTIYLSSSIKQYDKFFDINDFGESSYNGQACLFQVSASKLVNLTTDPISKRKDYLTSYNAYGSAVAISDTNLVIGAPIPLNNDLLLSTPLITESGSISDPNYKLTSSFNPESCDIASNVVYFKIEDTVYAENNQETLIAIKTEDSIQEELRGKVFIYDFKDLQTDYKIGNVFYNNNRVLINNTGSVFNIFTRDPIDTDRPYIHMEYQSQITLNEKQYVCKVERGEFNISTNPTAVTGSAIDYGIFNKENFDFNNLDIILRYINYKLTNPRTEEWWNSFISNDIETNIFNFYTSSIQNYTDNKLTTDLKSILSYKDFDINKDGAVTIQDGIIIWKYFIEDLNYTNYKNYINPISNRKNYDDILNFLNEKTGKFNKKIVKQSFFNYSFSSSIDPTGSYLAPYITQVGLFSGADLVAVAKLAHPIKNTGEIPINIIVKWDT